jgi:CBS domain-containing protein
MTIAAILSNKGSDVATVPTGTRVRDAVMLLKDRNIGAVPIVDGSRILGIFSERDLVGCLCAHGAEALDMAVDAGMSSPAVTVAMDTPVLAALSIMTNRRIRHLPVMESGRLRGIISIGDLVKHRIERIEAEAEALRSYIQSA